MLVLLVFAFLSGLVTIAAPCIWPLLPIVLSSSASTVGGASHKKPLGLTLGILLSFGILTLSLSYLVAVFKFDANILRIIAVAILFFLGFTLVFPPLTRFVEGLVSRFAGKFGSTNTSTGFWPGFISGLALGVVWAPCAGPILATIATLSATRAVGFQIVIVTIVYLIGVGIPLFIFSYAGQKVITKSRVFNKYTGVIQKIFGVIIIATALLIFSNYDKVIEANLLNTIPSYSNFITSLESNPAVQKQLNNIRSGTDSSDNIGKSYNPMPTEAVKNSLFNTSYPAPEFTGINKWLNLAAGQSSLNMKDLRGKVVLVDFWTYTCINCIRTLPFVTSWYDKYKDDGFVVVGVHTPEFQFEHDTGNVQNAIKQYKINYPVAQDNDYSTWNTFSNSYWPAEYLIDKNGNVRRTHFGEGEYDQTEMAIKALLKEAGKTVDSSIVNMPDQTPKDQISPESYIGSKRAEFYYPNGKLDYGSYTNLHTVNNNPLNSFTLGGSWAIYEEYGETGLNATLQYNFSADHVYLVMKPVDSDGGSVRVYLDDQLVDEKTAGKDVEDGVVTIDQDRLYDLVDLKGKPGNHMLRLEFSGGIQVFAFTFG